MTYEPETKTIRDIALEHPAAVRVFQEFKIDFCCGGKRLFDEACSAAGADPEVVTARISAAVRGEQRRDIPEYETATALINHIEKKHHAFARLEFERLTGLINRVVARHGQSRRELVPLQLAFDRLCRELLPHMHKEESFLFPYIKHLEMSAVNRLSCVEPPFGSVENPLRMMMKEHEEAAATLRKMRELTRDYTLPPDACTSFRALYHALEELEKDLHQHIHLENNVLFPKALELEAEVFNSAGESLTAEA